MFCKIIPEAYDAAGRKILRPGKKKFKVFHPTFPMGRFVSKPLTTDVSSFKDLRTFLCGCSYVSDQEQFNKPDYWLPPEEFEVRKKGDCEDFSLWTWRQLMNMGFYTRFVVGFCEGKGHAWVTVVINGNTYICEPLACRFKRISAMDTTTYEPEVSVDWDGVKIRYYAHENRQYTPSTMDKIRLNTGHLIIRIVRYSRTFVKLFTLPYDLPKNIIKSVVYRIKGEAIHPLKRYDTLFLCVRITMLVSLVFMTGLVIKKHYGFALLSCTAGFVLSSVFITLGLLTYIERDIVDYLRTTGPSDLNTLIKELIRPDIGISERVLKRQLKYLEEKHMIEYKEDASHNDSKIVSLMDI